MQYQYCPNNPEQYATNLRREQGTRNLKWDNARGQDVLIVQTTFGSSAETIIEELCVLMESAALSNEKYTELKPCVWVRFVSAADKARMGGCPINNEASTYTVFACSVEGNICKIYAPQNQAMISPHCNVPMDIHVEVMPHTLTKGLFKKTEVHTGYYRMVFPREVAGGYNSGDLYYHVDGMKVPVTRQMIEQETVYIKTSQRPELVSRNKGLVLI